MFVEELAAKMLREFWSVMDRMSLRVFIYGLKIPTKKKKRLSSLLYGVIANLGYIDWIMSILRLEPTQRSVDLWRVVIYRLFIERNSEVLQRIKSIDGWDLEDLYGRVEEIEKNLNTLPLVKRLAIRFSIPEFFVRRLLKFMNKNELLKLLKALNTRLPYTWGFINVTLYEPEEVLENLREEGYAVSLDAELYGLLKFIELPKRIEKSKAYRARMFIIAEKASVATTQILEPRPGHTILDMAAAPGIKLILTAFRMGHGKFYAVDISEIRLKRMLRLIDKYLAGMDINVKPIRLDARKLKPENLGGADRILLDAECSSSGMIPKSPDIKLRLNKERIIRLSTLQKQLLERAIYLGTNLGSEIIVYSVCSLLPDEGEYVISSITNKTTDYTLDRITIGDPPYIGGLGRRFFPHKHGTIGFFLARLRRTE